MQEYVRVRLIQFAGAFARRVKPNLSQQAVQTAAAEAIASLPPPELGRVAIENRDLQLVFRHDCLCAPDIRNMAILHMPRMSVA